MSESLRAVYKDEKGATYSCPVELRENKWMMLTSEGFQPITHEFKDDAAGTLTFIEYREVPDTRLHVEPGADSFRALQEAGARATAEYETRRVKQRREMLDTLNRPDPRKVSAAMRISAEYAALKKPRGKGAAFIIKNGDE